MSKTTKGTTRCERAYHVDWNEASDVWHVLNEDGRVLGHCADEAEATDIAIRQAHHDHSAGDDVIVCVQEKDGGYRVAWTSHRTRGLTELNPLAS